MKTEMESIERRIWLASRALDRASKSKNETMLKKAQQRYDRAVADKDRELARRAFEIAPVVGPRESAPAAVMCTPADAARIARPVMATEQETFVVVCLNIRNVMMAPPAVIAIGSAFGVEVHPRDVFREAIRRNAAGIVVLHNHPSGDRTPSREDEMITERLAAVGKLVGIPVIDHVIVTATDHLSLAERSPGLFS